MNIKVFDWEEIIVEGLAKIIIPKRELFIRPDGIYEPAWSPVFYNPLMELNRNITVLVTTTYFNRKEFFFIEPLSGTGIRGIRLALESNGYGYINDVDPLSYYYMERNISLNNLRGKLVATINEANTFLNNFTFSGIIVDYIDIDPYGSPIPFIDSAIRPLGKKALIGITATDTGPLTCSHKQKTLRRYGIRCQKVDFSKELGLRILLYNIAFRAASNDVAVYPLISFQHKYYYRVFLKTARSGNESYKLMDKCSGYIVHNLENLDRKFIKEPNEVKDHGQKTQIIGPLWICPLGDPDFIKEVINEGTKQEYINRETIDFLEELVRETTINQPYIRYDKLFGLHKKNMPSINTFIELIRKHGYEAYRTHFDPRGIKTNAPIEILHEIISSF